MVGLALLPAGVHAAIVAPDSTPNVTAMHANRNLVGTDDILLYGLADLPYATLPSVDNVTIPADVMFIFRLIESSTGAEVGMMTTFSDPSFGYGYNKQLIGFYFSAADNVMWGGSYIIRISQNPTYFPSPAYNDVSVPGSAWTLEMTQSANQVDLANHLYAIGQTLQGQFDKDLFQHAGGQQVLTSDGETYYRGSIQGLQAMAPQLFLIQQVPRDTSADNWTTEQFDEYEQRFQGTWVGEGMNAAAEQVTGSSDPNSFGSPSMVIFLVAITPFCGLFIIVSARKFKRIEAGLIASALLLTMGVLMGWVPKAIFASIYQVCHIYIGYLLFGARG